MKQSLIALLCWSTASAFAVSAHAEVSPQTAAALGATLTPAGAQKAGSRDGVIPLWTGGEAQRGSMDKPEFPNDPAVDGDKPLFTISHTDYQKYADQLSAGQKELFRRYGDYKMVVYPTRRVASFPEFIYRNTAWNATHCKLIGTDTPDQCRGGFPYPIPTNGAQIVWNHMLRWRTDAVRRYNQQAIVQPNGRYQVTKLLEDVKFFIPNSQHPDYTLTTTQRDTLYYLNHTIEPPRLAGTFTLVHDRTGVGADGRVAWLYSPGVRRIRRAPTVQYDNPVEGTDGNQYYDQVDMFNGNLALYDWKLIGKREMFIPYNSNKISTAGTTIDDIIHPHHMNQNLARYERHRVWVVEAQRKPGKSHVFKKRVMYFDEDTWLLVEEDDYDNRGTLYKYHEGYMIFQPQPQASTTVPEVIYDFASGRYFMTAMINGTAPNKFDVEYADSYFTPAALQKMVVQ